MNYHLFPELARPVAEIVKPRRTINQQIADLAQAYQMVAFAKEDADRGYTRDLVAFRANVKKVQDILDALNNDLADGEGSGLEDAEANIVCKLRQNAEPEDFGEFMTSREIAKRVARYVAERDA